jgi:DNA-binding NarL/FixJ family response regulator
VPINSKPVRVAVAQFEDIVAHGLRALINEDENLSLVADGVPHDQLESALSAYDPDVALLNFGSLISAIELRDLHRDFSSTRLVVLANRPTPSECRQMLAFGATACLAKSTEARACCTPSTWPPGGCTCFRPRGWSPQTWSARIC